jgi:HD-like signal output (HDOD) protein
MPRVAERVLRELRGTDYDVSKISRELGEDQVIAASVLRMANSVLYGGVNRVASLEPAVARLGSNALRTLMLQHSLHASLNFRGRDGIIARRIWTRSLASSAIMEKLAKLSSVDTSQASLVGLLHTVGEIVVLKSAQEQQDALRYRMNPEEFEFVCQRLVEPLNARAAQAWELPDELTSLISHFQAYPSRGDPQRNMRLLLHVTSMVLSLLEYAPTEPYNLLESRAVGDLGLARNPLFVQTLERLPAQLEERLREGK